MNKYRLMIYPLNNKYNYLMLNLKLKLFNFLNKLKWKKMKKK